MDFTSPVFAHTMCIVCKTTRQLHLEPLAIVLCEQQQLQRLLWDKIMLTHDSLMVTRAHKRQEGSSLDLHSGRQLFVHQLAVTEGRAMDQRVALQNPANDWHVPLSAFSSFGTYFSYLRYFGINKLRRYLMMVSGSKRIIQYKCILLFHYIFDDIHPFHQAMFISRGHSIQTHQASNQFEDTIVRQLNRAFVC